MKDKKNVYDSLILVMQFGINMIVPILLCTGIGVWIYKKYGHPIVVILLFMAGALAGFQNIYRMAKRIYERDDKKDRKHVKKN